jgi:hypothetical protein
MKFNNVLGGLAALTAAAGLATGASAAGSVNASAVATATVLSPVSLTKTQDLAFGSIVRPSTGTTTATLSTAGVLTLSPGTDAAIVAGTRTAAKFNIAAPAGQTYTPVAILTLAGLTGVAAGTPVVDTGTVGALGAALTTQQITYGGQFDVSSTTTPQLYTGTLALTINYP